MQRIDFVDMMVEYTSGIMAMGGEDERGQKRTHPPDHPNAPPPPHEVSGESS
jgi:hypothetical protein